MILTPITEKYSSLTQAEKKIADCILNDPEHALMKTASELGEISNTSSAAAIRFSRKIGFDSFSDMKIGLAKYLHSNQIVEKDMIVAAGDSYQVCTQKLLAQITDVASATANRIDFSAFSKAVMAIERADCIYLFGVGASAIVAMDMQQKLIRINKKTVFLQDSQIGLLSTLAITKTDVVMAFSFSGETKSVLSSIKSAAAQGAFIVAITRSDDSPVARIANVSLCTPAVERKVRIGAVSSHYSQQFICDSIFLSLISDHYLEAENLTLQAAALVEDIR